MHNTASSSSQWLFPPSALLATPSACPLEKELYDRARGVEFLFRLGTSLGLPSSAMFTAATWFHRFYMRYAMEDYHRQDVAAACIFLATKTEECGRKLRDVARICWAKISNKNVDHIPADSKEVEQCQTTILLTEEVLLEALCFDFIVESPHAELVKLFAAHEDNHIVQDSAWSIAHDSYRTPLCLLYPPQITATACSVLAARVVDGPNSPSLDARIAFPSPSNSLPTPPSNKPATPDASRFSIEYYAFDETQLQSVGEALSILLEFYCVQDLQASPYLLPLTTVPPPAIPTTRPRFYSSFAPSLPDPPPSVGDTNAKTPASLNGDNASPKGTSTGQAPRLDLS